MSGTNNIDYRQRSRLMQLLVHTSSRKLAPPPPNTRRAGVALVLTDEDPDLEILFIRRASHDGDPWSGHIAFPGGHYQPSDENLLHTVIRETLEEVGITLRPSDFVRQLPYEKPYTSDQPTELVVLPYVFLLKQKPTIKMNHEVSDIQWVSICSLVSGELDAQETVYFNANQYRLPGYRLDEQSFVWGLTYRVLQHFFESIRDR